MTDLPQRLGAGDAAYIMAWCAWRKAEIQGYTQWSEAEARQRFVRWWNETGSVQLEQYGYHLLDTEGKRP